jgi:hypothetical protein
MAMADGGTSGSGMQNGLRTLSNELLQASDSKILKITRMIDLLPDRGEADLLLQQVRCRLASLRPARQMSRTRLLFVPLDSVVVSAANWRPGDLTIPRSIIAPLSALILAHIPDELPPFDADDQAALTRAGAPLWAAAGVLLADLAIPDHWGTPDWQKQHGLTVPMVTQLVGALRLVLSHAVEIRSLSSQGDPACEPTLAALLADAARSGPLGWGIMLALLLEVAAPDQVARLALALARGTRLSTTLLAGLDRATSNTLDRMETQIAEPAPEELLDPARLLARVGLISRIERFRRLEQRPAEEQRRVGRLRQTLATANRSLFEQALQSRLPGSCAPVEAEAVYLMEAEARQLRRFALAASKLGDGDEYDRLLEQAAVRYTDTSVGTGLTLADRLRLTELLIGSERAIQALGLG